MRLPTDVKKSKVLTVDSRSPLRETIRAFQSSAKRELLARGWRKHSGDIYTLDLGDEYFVWLGLNKATKYRPMSVNPVVGIGHSPTNDLLKRFAIETSGEMKFVRAILSQPLGRIRRIQRGEPLNTPGHWELSLDLPDEADREVEVLVRNLEEYGLPFISRLANPLSMTDALRKGDYLPVKDYVIKLLPAFLACTADVDEAVGELRRLVSERLEGRDDMAAQEFCRFAEAFEEWAAERDGAMG